MFLCSSILGSQFELLSPAYAQRTEITPPRDEEQDDQQEQLMGKIHVFRFELFYCVSAVDLEIVRIEDRL